MLAPSHPLPHPNVFLSSSMGVGDLANLCFSKVQVDLKTLVAALRARFNVEQVVVGVDVRIVMHQVFRSRKDNRFMGGWCERAAQDVIRLFEPWVGRGCRVVLVDDGKASNSKVAHFLRRAEMTRKRAFALRCLDKVRRLRSALQRGGDDDNDDDDYDDDDDEVQGGIQGRIAALRREANKAWKSPLPFAFSEALERGVAGRDNMAYVRAPYQADPQLVDMFLGGKCHAVVSTDGDFLVYGCRFIVSPPALKPGRALDLRYVGEFPFEDVRPRVPSLPPSPGAPNDYGVKFAALSLPARIICSILFGNDALPFSYYGFGKAKCKKMLHDDADVLVGEHSVRGLARAAVQWCHSNISVSAQHRYPSEYVICVAAMSLMFEPIQCSNNVWPLVDNVLGHMGAAAPWVCLHGCCCWSGLVMVVVVVVVRSNVHLTVPMPRLSLLPPGATSWMSIACMVVMPCFSTVSSWNILNPT